MATPAILPAVMGMEVTRVIRMVKELTFLANDDPGVMVDSMRQNAITVYRQEATRAKCPASSKDHSGEQMEYEAQVEAEVGIGQQKDLRRNKLKVSNHGGLKYSKAYRAYIT